MTEHQSCVIHKISESEGETRGYYRFLENDKVTENDLINELQKQCKGLVCENRVLVISDTCTINLEKNKNRLIDRNGLYNIGENRTKKTKAYGFISHALLVHDRDGEEIRGVGNVEIINRPMIGNKRPANWKKHLHPIEEKESYRWITANRNIRDTVLSKSKHVLYVMDREGDDIEVFDKLKTEKSDILIRSNHNRRVIDEQGKKCKIKELIKKQTSLGTIEVKVKSKKRKKRKAILDVKITRAKILWSSSKKVTKKLNPEGINVSIIEVRELKHNGYKSEPPLVWRLITTEVINTFEQGVEIVKCYEKRWKIEEFFKLLKTDGFNIEGTELTKGRIIRKLLLLIMKSSIKILQLKSARNGESSVKIREVFTEEEIICLEKLNNKLEGTSLKQRNPYKIETLSWGSWVIARLGGWKQFYDKSRPPGNKTLVWGLERFEAIMIGYNISNKKDVS